MILRAIEEKRFLPVGADREAVVRFPAHRRHQQRSRRGASRAGRVPRGSVRPPQPVDLRAAGASRPARGYRAQSRLRARPLRRARGHAGQLQQGGAPRLPRFRDRARGALDRQFPRPRRQRHPDGDLRAGAAGSTSRRVEAEIVRLQPALVGRRPRRGRRARRTLARPTRRRRDRPVRPGPARRGRPRLPRAAARCPKRAAPCSAPRARAARLANDADRLRKYLQRFGLDWAQVSG